MTEDASDAKRLCTEWQSWLIDQAETGMGYQTGDVVLRDGSIVRDVVIIQSTLIAGVRGHETVPFDSDDIVEIRLTHKKWDWQREP